MRAGKWPGWSVNPALSGSKVSTLLVTLFSTPLSSGLSSPVTVPKLLLSLGLGCGGLAQLCEAGLEFLSGRKPSPGYGLRVGALAANGDGM